MMMGPREVVQAWADAFNSSDAEAAGALYAEDAVNEQIAAGEPKLGRTVILEGAVVLLPSIPGQRHEGGEPPRGW
jgi:hypothetical protein